MPPSPNSAAARVDPARAAAILDAHRLGRDGALEELIRVCEPFVRQQAQRFAWTRNEVDDIAQEVWLKLMLKADQIEDTQTLLAWLQVVTRRMASLLGHRSARCVPTALDDADVPTEASTEDVALATVENDQRHSIVTAALGRLDGPEQHLLLLLHADSRPGYEGISRRVNRPIGSLGPTRQRLLRRLRRDHEICRLAGDAEAA